MKKRFLLLVMVVVLVLQCVGCAGKGGETTINANGDASTLISKEPIELTAFVRASSETDGQWKMFKKAAEMTNVFVKSTVSKSNSNMTQSFNIMLASGDIPDLVFVQDELQFVGYGQDGAFVALNKYFDLMPNFKAFLDEHPTVKKNLTASDGNIYYTPTVPGGKASVGWFIRQDWLDKLNLEAPTNAEEMHNVLTAFKTKDPNGNGQADEIPFFGNGKLKEFFPLWGARKDWYVDGDQVKYGPLDPEYKTAMKNLIQWYKEGLFDTEILTRANDAMSVVMNNKGGMTNDWFGSTSRLNDTLKDEFPGFKFVPFAPPENIVLENRGDNYQYGWGIYTGTKHLEEAVKYLDFWFSVEGNRLINFGEEGVHWELVDGEPKFKEELLAMESPLDEIRKFGCQMGIGYVQDFNYEKQWLNQIGADGMTMYNEGNWFAPMLPPIYLQMTPDEVEEYSMLKTQIDTHTEEMYQRWILGTVDFDSTYDQYIKELKKLDVDRLLELQQGAYEKYQKVK